MRLFSERLNKLRSGFGFETFVLSVLDLEALDPTQLCLSHVDPVDDNTSFDALVDRLGMRLGFEAVNRICIRESVLPEYSVELRSTSETTITSAEWPSYRIRPVQLIDPPRRIQVSVVIPGESPVTFRMGQQSHRILRSEGPERLTAEWWRDRSARWASRDYYRIDDERGLRFWIFRDPQDHWFLHGQLP